jgi:hypothetical protein
MKIKAYVSLAAGLALLGLVGCASSAGGRDRAPHVTIQQAGDVLAMGVQPRGGIPMEYVVIIENPFEHEVTLRTVQIESVGEAGGYSLNRVRAPFEQIIAAGATRELPIRAWVRVLTESDVRSVDHPVLLRGLAHFDSPTGAMTRQFTARVNTTRLTSSRER